MARKPFIAEKIELVDHVQLIPADYNPRQMDDRTLRVLVRSLTRFGWVLPVVANRRTGNIVGGHQRARANLEIVRSNPGNRAKHFHKVPVIYVDLSEPEEKALNVALNQISGDWDFFKRTAADELRQNATFAQMTRKHHELSRGYRAPLGLKRFDFRDKSHAQQFVSYYGSRIVDFGCGRGQEIDWLSKIGIRAVGFEPFRRVRGSSRLTVKTSREQADQFLAALGSNLNPQTVFCNFVVSSIAHPKERAHVLTILHALCQRGAKAIIAVRSTDDVCYQQVLGRVQASSSGYLGIPDASEPGLIVTSAGTPQQKFQKFFGRDEFVKLLRRWWGGVEIAALEPRDPALVAVCTNPREIDHHKLESALRFEFDLAINAERMGRADAAVRSFSRWLERGCRKAG